MFKRHIVMAVVAAVSTGCASLFNPTVARVAGTAAAKYGGEITTLVYSTLNLSPSTILSDVGDLNGDGVPDMVVAYSSLDFVILVGDGLGNYSENSRYTPFGSISDADIQILDFDKDGINDIVAVESSSAGRLTIFWGNNTATFGSQLSQVGYQGVGEIGGFAVADFTGDGNNDIVFSQEAADNLLLCAGGGSARTLTAAGSCTSIALGVGEYSEGVLTALMNGDANPDLVVALRGSDEILVALGNGAGGFPTQNRIALTVGSSPYRVAVGNLNADSNLDIVASTFTDDNLETLTADDGTATAYTLLPTITTPTGGRTKQPEIVDIDGDSVYEVVVPHGGPSNSQASYVLVYENDGAANLSFDQDVPVGGGAFKVNLANYDAVAGIDLLLPAMPGIKLISGATDGTFSLSEMQYTAGDLPSDIQGADFDSDGDIDLIVAHENDNNIGFFRNNGNGTFAAMVPYASVTSASEMAVADFDGDGDLDVAVVSDGSAVARIHANNGAGVFTTPYADLVLNDSGRSIVAGDWDGDNDWDLAIGVGSAGDRVEIWDGNGAGGFAMINQYPLNSDPGRVCTADFDKDGNLDLLVGGRGVDSKRLMGAGDGSFTSNDLATTGHVYTCALADFNGDGYVDLFYGDRWSSQFYFRPNNGSGDFPTTTSVSIASTAFDMDTADLDGDGKSDLVTVFDGLGAVTVHYGDGAGGLRVPGRSITSHRGGRGLVIKDLNGDGELDIASVYANSDSLQVSLAKK